MTQKQKYNPVYIGEISRGGTYRVVIEYVEHLQGEDFVNIRQFNGDYPMNGVTFRVSRFNEFFEVMQKLKKEIEKRVKSYD